MPKTILLADDSPTIRKVVELTFGDTGIRVETAASGGEALDRFERVRPDLVLADVVMPEPAGYELCRRVKASDHPVPVLLLAGTFDPYDADRARDCGADGRILKPFESRALVERVEALLSGARAPAPVAPCPPPYGAYRPAYPVAGARPLFIANYAGNVYGRGPRASSAPTGYLLELGRPEQADAHHALLDLHRMEAGHRRQARHGVDRDPPGGAFVLQLGAVEQLDRLRAGRRGDGGERAGGGEREQESQAAAAGKRFFAAHGGVLSCRRRRWWR